MVASQGTVRRYRAKRRKRSQVDLDKTRKLYGHKMTNGRNCIMSDIAPPASGPASLLTALDRYSMRKQRNSADLPFQAINSNLP